MATCSWLTEAWQHGNWRLLKRVVQEKRDQWRRVLGQKCFDVPLTALSPCRLSECKRIVLVRWDAKFGDAFVSSFLFRELRKANPELSIVVITTAQLAPLFEHHWGADEVHICRKRAGYLELDRLARKIGEADLLVHLSKELKPKDLFFIRRLHPAHVASLDDEPRCVDIKLRQQCAGMHFADKLAHLLKLCGVENVDTAYWLPHDEQRREAVSAFLPARYRHIIAFNPYGAGHARRLDEESICKVIALIKAKGNQYGVCLLHAPGEREEVERIVERFRGQGVFFYPQSNSILDVVAQIEVADGLISVDTATVHIASGLRKPLLALYNPDPENYADWGPNSPNALVLFSTAKRPFDINTLNWPQMDDGLSLFLSRVTQERVA